MNNIIFRTTNDCNLCCRYCYDWKNHSNLSLEDKKNQATATFNHNVNDIIQDVCYLLEHSRNPRMIFHGGEPLLVNANELNTLCNELKKRLPIQFGIQTNATLIDQKAIDFFKNQNISVGISLDGADEEQNKDRVDTNNQSTFQMVMDKLKWLQQEQINFGLVMSVTKNHIGKEQAIYDFLATNGYYCNIRPVFARSGEDNTNLMTECEYITFFNHLFDIWYQDEKQRVSTYQIAELAKNLTKVLLDMNRNQEMKQLLESYLSLENASLSQLPSYHENVCSASDHCFEEFISLDCLGELYACNRLYQIPAFYYGNIRKMSKEKVLEKAKELLIKRNQQINQSCGTCQNFIYCHGGCPAESYDLYGDIYHRSINCNSEFQIQNHIKKKVLEL